MSTTRNLGSDDLQHAYEQSPSSSTPLEETEKTHQQQTGARPWLSRSEQARVNGAKSHGPTSDQGKFVSSRNARKHGFCARVSLFDAESDPLWRDYIGSYVRAFRPLNQPEMDAVEQLAESRWRRKRVITIETTLFNLALGHTEDSVQAEFDNCAIDDALRIAIAWKQECGDRVYDLARRYIVSAERSYTRAFSELRLLQGKRFQSIPEPEFASAAAVAASFSYNHPEIPSPNSTESPGSPEVAAEQKEDEEQQEKEAQQDEHGAKQNVDSSNTTTTTTAAVQNEPKPAPLETYYIPQTYGNRGAQTSTPNPDSGGEHN